MSVPDPIPFIRLIVGLVAIAFAAPLAANASRADTSYYYCRSVNGQKFTDFALTIIGSQVTLQPHSSQESPGIRIYHGKVTKITKAGNYRVNFNSYSQVQFLSSFPDIIFTPTLFNKGTQGEARVLTSNPDRDPYLSCSVKKIFY